MDRRAPLGGHSVVRNTLSSLIFVFAATAATNADSASEADRSASSERIAEIERRLSAPPKLGAHQRSALLSELSALRTAGVSTAETAAGSPGREPSTVLERLRAHRDALAVNPRGVRRHGAGTHARIRAEQAETEALVADLEAGETVDPVRVAALLGDSLPVEGEVVPVLVAEREALERRLRSGGKLGMVERRRLREAVRALDERIAAVSTAEDDVTGN